MRTMTALLIAALVLAGCSVPTPREEFPSATPTPRPGREPTAVCVDGSLSFARERQGACSWHGGDREWRR